MPKAQFNLTQRHYIKPVARKRGMTIRVFKHADCFGKRAMGWMEV